MLSKILTLGTASRLSKTQKEPLKTLKEGKNNAANTKGGTDGQTSRRLKRIAVVGF